MKNLADALKLEASKTFTEKGEVAYSTTGNAVLDLFARIGALRNVDDSEIEQLFERAYQEDPLLAIKCMFYARDIRGGLGERKTFRILLDYVGNKHPEAIIPNIHLIPFYGRCDDLYALVSTQAEDKMWTYVKLQLVKDLDAPVGQKSLLAKWLKSPDTSSKASRALGIYTANKLEMSIVEYKTLIRKLRASLRIVERDMSANQWDKIDYPTVPSRAMTAYRNAFTKRDGDRFVGEYLKSVSEGKAKIHSDALFPYDIIDKYFASMGMGYYGMQLPKVTDPVLEEQWKALPNYIEEGSNAMVIADLSGSMIPKPIFVAISLAIYFAERNSGPYKDLWMSFSKDSTIHHLSGDTLRDKISNLTFNDWGATTNIEAAFDKILNAAIEAEISPDMMVKSLIIISDMEFDESVSDRWGHKPDSNHWGFYKKMKDKYAEAGYAIPNIVFWNVDSRHNTFHADSTREGVQLCSGSSPSVFKQLMNAIGKTPEDLMHDVLNNERYAPITIGK